MFYGLIGIDGKLEFLGELSDLRSGALEIERNSAAGFGPEDDVLGDSHRLDQHEVLVDHTDAECDRVVRRFDIAHLPIDKDLATFSGVETVGDTHRRGLSRAILADDGVDRPRLNDDIDVIVGEYVAEAFCYLSEFEHSEVEPRINAE